jgi:hypothetical protein
LINSKFENAKELQAYDNGFNTINSFLEKELSTLSDVKAKIEKYQNEVLEIENKYGEKFNNITIPNIVSNSSNLVVASPSSFVPNTSNTNFFSNSSFEEEKEEKTEKVEEKKEEKESQPLTGERIESSNGSNSLGILAGAVGVLGAGGLAASAYMKSREDEEETEEEIIPEESTEKEPTEKLNIVEQTIKEG